MADKAPQEKKISVRNKPKDQIIEGKNNQILRMSFSDLTDAGYIDIAVLSEDQNKDIQPALARIFLSKEDNADSVFGLAGKGTNKKSAPCIVIQGDNIRIVSKNSKNVQSAVLGNNLVAILMEILDSLITHEHPLESVSVGSIQKWKEIKGKLETTLSKVVSIS